MVANRGKLGAHQEDLMNIKEIATTLAILGTGSLVVAGCNKDAPATEVPAGVDAPAADAGEANCAEGHTEEGHCGGADGEAAADGGEEGEASCSGEGEGAEGEASCSGK